MVDQELISAIRKVVSEEVENKIEKQKQYMNEKFELLSEKMEELNSYQHTDKQVCFAVDEINNLKQKLEEILIIQKLIIEGQAQLEARQDQQLKFLLSEIKRVKTNLFQYEK